ncbi:MAG: deoxynucleoside kinase [Clostridia bacterium]|nr:deoxynucleoside kinase [Clostridia bacterium]
MPLIVIEGVDCSGKETQTENLYNNLKNKGHKVMRISFPDYESDSSALVKMYLRGDFGKSAYDVNPYTASAFFAVDRFASYKTKWGEFLKDGIVIADRYVTSNMVHQASKMATVKEKEEYINWLYDFEYERMGLPKPDMVLFLDMPPEISARLNEARKNKITGEDVKDIHESDLEYLKASYENAHFVATHQNWRRVDCAPNNNLRTIEDISREMLKVVEEIL